MKKRDRLMGVVSITLVVLLLLGALGVLGRGGYNEPDNPISILSEELLAETLNGGGSLSGTSDSETVENSRDSEVPPPDEELTTKEEDKDEEEKLPPEKDEIIPDENNGNGESDNELGGSTDSGNDGEGGISGEEGDGGEDSPQIATDLRSMQITRSELPDGKLQFYAYAVGEGDDLSVKVVLKNSKTSFNGIPLESEDGINYEAQLEFNEANEITIYLRKNGENINYVKYRIRYEADKADENNPTVGDNPPVILTNLDDIIEDDDFVMKTQDFVFWVSARTQPEGDVITSNNIEVYLNGKLIPKQTGDSRPEYELHFEPPNVGDYADYNVKVRAWDGKGNSTFKVYNFRYHTVSEGDRLGEVNVILDASTVGLGIIEEATYEVVQGDTAAGIVIKFLEEYGYDAVYDGSAKTGFYLRRIYRGDLCYGAKVPDKLWECILRDGLTTTGEHDRDSLGEFDYTMGSGWMYSINGEVYPGRGLSAYPVSGGDKIYIRFTLSYGKDIGGFDVTGEGKGKLSSYCGVWLNGGYQPISHNFTEWERVEATETEDGYIEYRCTKCHETKREVLPMTGNPEPDDPEPDNPEPDDPEPDNPEPDDPEPDNPEPDDPEPDNPEPDDPEPDDPESDNPEPDNPEPDNPEPDNPEPDDPEPDDPEPDNPEPDNPEPDNPAPEVQGE